MMTLMTWHMMRARAIRRHQYMWMACGCNPYTYPLHMALIRAVYGY